MNESTRKYNVENIYGNVKVVRNRKYEWAVVDLNDNIIVPFGKYAWIDGFDHGLARVRTKGKTVNKNETLFLFDENGKTKSLKGEEYTRYMEDERRKNPDSFAKWGIINEKGEEVLPVVHEEVWNFLGKGRQSTKVKTGGVEWDFLLNTLNPTCDEVKEIEDLPFNCQLDYQDDYSYDEAERDTWYAMTEGMYGDMPDDFDGDYSFLGY